MMLKADEGQEGEIISIAFSPDGETLATLGSDFTAGTWEINSKP